MNGKGSKRRPRQVDRKRFAENWEMAFGKKGKTKSATRTSGLEGSKDLPPAKFEKENK